MADTTSPSADVAVTNIASRALISPYTITPVTYTITVTNLGNGTGQNDTAQNVVMTDSTMYYQSVNTTGSTVPVQCTTPAVNGFGTVSCTTPSLRRTSTSGDVMKITLNAKVSLFSNQCTTGNVANVTSSTFDPNLSDNTAAVSFKSTAFRCQ